MKKVIVILVAVMFAMGAGMALASPKVGGLSQKGSVLVFPKIDTTDWQETVILISNDNNQPVTVYCQWVIVGGEMSVGDDCNLSSSFKRPPTQSGADFVFTLTPFQPTIIEASSGTIGCGPGGVNGFGEDHRGFLACWAVDSVLAATQINFNHLSGMAYVIGAEKGYSYPAWAFQALAGNFKGPVGTPGLIKFDACEYDAMPQYLVFNVPTFDTRTGVRELDFENLDLTLIQGKQDFTTMARTHKVTRVNFDAWDINENRYSGAGLCIWCFYEDELDNVKMANGYELFDSSTMHSPVARFRVQGKASAGCLPDLTLDQVEHCFGQYTVLDTQASPLLGLAVQLVDPPPYNTFYYTTNLPVGVAQDFTASFVWGHY